MLMAVLSVLVNCRISCVQWVCYKVHVLV
jgi:hypothetical protein